MPGSKLHRRNMISTILVGAACFLSVVLLSSSVHSEPGGVENAGGSAGAILLVAKQIFDGTSLRKDEAILVNGSSVVEVGRAEILKSRATKLIDLGDATILPGFIELHAHVLLRKVPQEVLLKHGVTTVRDVGGPLLQPSGGDGKLRVLTAGPIITIQDGYPISVFGKGYVAEAVQSPGEAKSLVSRLVQGGAALIKIALEPGGEAGAPWSRHHGNAAPPWPMADQEIISAIVTEAHRLGRIVTAHIGENRGAALALSAGVDEWAHVPCLDLDDDLIRQAAKQKIRVVTTFDTMSHCPGVLANGRKLAGAGISLLYGAETAHDDVPWGIDAQELRYIQHSTGMSELEVLRTATSEAGKELGMEPLGTIAAGAPADLIAVKGDPLANFKILEYPDLVMSGGVVVLDNFSQRR